MPELLDASYELAKFEAILRSIGDGLLVANKEGNVALINKAAADMLGWTVDEAVGKAVNVVAPILNEIEKVPDHFEEKEESVLSFISTGIRSTTTYYLVRKDKTRFPASITSSSVMLGSEIIGAVIVFRDVTAEKESERAKSDFIAIASHQLRTPLGSMKWNLEMLKNGDFGGLTPDARLIIDQVLQSSVRMVSLVNDLLSVSRIEQGRVYDQPVETDVVEVLNDAITEMLALAKQKEVTISLALPPDKVPLVVLDHKRFREVVQNLLSNAVKYNQPKGKVDVKLDKTDKLITIHFADTGIGIPKPMQNRMFSKFFRADNAIAQDTEGTGLGLYVVKSYVESWGGKISFENRTDGPGTIFHLELPLSPKRGS